MLKEVNPLLAWFEKNWIISLLIAIFFAGLIFYISSVPASGFPSGLGIKTKIYHLGVYALLAFFLSLAVIRGKISNKYLIIIAILLAAAYACSDEIHQFFVPGRHCTFRDVFIDITGALIAVVFYYALREK
jgi:VanZ family protein